MYSKSQPGVDGINSTPPSHAPEVLATPAHIPAIPPPPPLPPEILAALVAKDASENGIWATQVTLYSTATSVQPKGKLSLAEVATIILFSQHASLVRQIREQVSAGNIAAVKALKRRLPAITVNGLQITRDKGAPPEKRAMKFTGFMQVDLDGEGLGEHSPESCRNVMIRDPHVQFTWISPGGKGVKVIFRIPICHHSEEFARAFHAVDQYLSEKYGFQLDSSTKDPGRLCYLGWDPELKLRLEPARDLWIPPIVTKEGNKEHKAHKPVSAKTLSDVLKHIPGRRPYDQWLRVTSAVFNVTDLDTGVELLNAWDPEDEPGLYAEKHRVRLKDIGFGTLVMLAKENGYRPKPSSRSQDIFLVPAGQVSITESAESIFPVIGSKLGLFRRGTAIGEIHPDHTIKRAVFLQITPERLCSLVETFCDRLVRREETQGRTILRTTRLPVQAAKVLLQSDAARLTLPPLAQICTCPILTHEGETLGQGYHPHGGGTFICTDTVARQVPLERAVDALLALLDDFEFASDSDKARAVAGLLSPALKMGGWLNDDFPLDLGEGDQSQAGKTLRQLIICFIYGAIPSSVVSPRGGVGSLDESISRALIAGNVFIMIDNYRGKLDSPIMEQAIRGTGMVACRAVRTSAEIDCRPFLWFMTTNGAELTKDLTNRAIITRIRKRPEGFQFRNYPEGSLKEHVTVHQQFYLDCVFAVLREWLSHGCPRTAERRHAFQEWCGSLDWIVQNIFRLPPLLDGHRAEQTRTATPALQWLRQVTQAVKTAGKLNQDLKTAALLQVAGDAELPGAGGGNENPCQRAGKLLARIFLDHGDRVSIDGLTLIRCSVEETRHGHGGEQVYVYRVVESTSVPSPPPTSPTSP